jgi:arsenite-transporting ATPase
MKLLEYRDSDQYDVIIVDCAPTGETLSLLKYPEKLIQLIEKVLPTKRKLTKQFGPVIEKITSIPMPKDSVFGQAEELSAKLYELQTLMSDHDQLSLRIVTTPEKIVIAEAKRNFTWLYLFGYNVDAVFINRILPKPALSGYFHPWLSHQKEGIKQIRESFSFLPVFPLELQPGEVVGMDSLLDVSEKIFGSHNPIEVFFQDEIYTVTKDDEGYYLSLNLPFAQKEQISMSQKGTDLTIEILNEKRVYTLPDALLGKDITSAKFAEGHLVIAMK